MLREAESKCIGYADFIDLCSQAERPQCFKRLTDLTTDLLKNTTTEISRLVLIQNALIDTAIFLDTKSRWSTTSNREKLDLETVVKNLEITGALSEKAARALLYSAHSVPEAVNVGLNSR